MLHYHKQNDTRYKAAWTSELSVGKLVESAVTSPFIHPVEGLLLIPSAEWSIIWAWLVRQATVWRYFFFKQPIKNVLLPCWWLCQVVVGLCWVISEMLVVNYSQTGLITRDKGENQNKQTAETVEFTANKSGEWNLEQLRFQIVFLVRKRWSLRQTTSHPWHRCLQQLLTNYSLSLANKKSLKERVLQVAWWS